jgi:hypothetical protein
VPFAETVPPLAVHVTPVLVEFVTDAVNCAVAPAFTVAVVGDTVTATAGGGGGGSVEESPPQAATPVTTDNKTAAKVRRWGRVRRWPVLELSDERRGMAGSSITE